MEEMKKRETLIIEWMKELGQDIVKNKDEAMQVEEKSSFNDLVTNMDKSIEEELTSRIREHFPNDRIVGEEGYGDDVTDLQGTIWFLDPIDGTLNFVKQRENFALMIGVFVDGLGQLAAVYDVMKDKLYSARKGDGIRCNGQSLEKPDSLPLSEGLLACSSVLMVNEENAYVRELGRQSMGVRALGSAGLEVVEVAKGNVVAYMARNLKPWDIAPGVVFMQELGMKATQFDGSELDMLTSNHAVFGTGPAHEEIVRSHNNQ